MSGWSRRRWVCVRMEREEVGVRMEQEEVGVCQDGAGGGWVSEWSERWVCVRMEQEVGGCVSGWSCRRQVGVRMEL